MENFKFISCISALLSQTGQNCLSHPEGEDKLATFQLCPNEISLMRPGKLTAVLVLICGQKLEPFHPPAWKTLREGKKRLSVPLFFCVGVRFMSGSPARAYDSVGSQAESSTLVFIRICDGVCVHVLRLVHLISTAAFSVLHSAFPWEVFVLLSCFFCHVHPHNFSAPKSIHPLFYHFVQFKYRLRNVTGNKTVSKR